MAARHLVSLAILVSINLSLAPTSSAAVPPATGDDALAFFLGRVQAYARLHRRVEAAVPPLAPTANPWDILDYQRRLAAAIRNERAGAREGDVVTADAAAEIRDIIAAALGPRNLQLPQDEGWPAYRATIDEPLPPGTSHMFPGRLLRRLPQLPEELEYRIVDGDLVLWDVDANLVIDVVREVFVVPSFA